MTATKKAAAKKAKPELDEPAAEDLARKAEAVTGNGGELADADERAQVAWRVRSLYDGYRRAGRAWSTAGDEVPLEALSEEALSALEEDPEIVLEPVFAPAPQEGDGE